MSAPKLQNVGATPTRTVSGVRPLPEAREEPFGAYLMRARELRGISLDQIADETRIHKANLRALEEDDRSRLPERVFVLGYIRAYAKAIGIDSNEAILRYDEYLQSREPPPPSTPLQRPRRKPRQGHIVLIASILAVVIAVFACLRLVMGLADRTAPDARPQDVALPGAPNEVAPPVPMPAGEVASDVEANDPEAPGDLPDPAVPDKAPVLPH